MKELTIKNINRNRRFALQAGEVYLEGTLRQIAAHIGIGKKLHPAYQAHWRFYYDGQLIDSAFVFCTDSDDDLGVLRMFDGWRDLRWRDLYDSIDDRPETGDLKVRVIEGN